MALHHDPAAVGEAMMDLGPGARVLWYLRAVGLALAIGLTLAALGVAVVWWLTAPEPPGPIPYDQLVP